MSDHPRPAYLRLRQEVVCTVVVAIVACLAALFAHVFREAVLAGIDYATGTDDAVAGARQWRHWMVALGIAAGLLVGIGLAHLANRWRGEQTGLQATAAAAAGEGPGPSLRATLLRSSGTLTASVSMASLGREAAILETGGAIGFAAGRRLWGRAPAVAAAGVAAAFASAYHAPFAAVVYVERHLHVRGRFPAGYYTVAGAAIGFTLTKSMLDGGPLLAHSTGSFGGMAAMAAIATPAAFIGSWLFATFRESSRILLPVGRSPWIRVALLAIVAGVTVGLVPLSAGNGLEGLRAAALDTSLGVALALGVAKMLATVAAIRSGAPGGVFSPSLAVAAGWALLAFHGVEALGFQLPGQRWDGMLVAMSMGITVSLGMPVLGGIVVAEMAGDIRLLPLCAVASLLATVVTRRLGRRRGGATAMVGHPLRDDEG